MTLTMTCCSLMFVDNLLRMTCNLYKTVAPQKFLGRAVARAPISRFVRPCGVRLS